MAKRKAPTRTSDGSCVVCGGDINLMVHRGTNVCSQRCEKLLKGAQ